MSRRLPMTTIAAGLCLGVTLGCAGKRRASQSPADCMMQCDQEQCQYKADGLGDNAAYLECLKACEDECGIESEQ